MDGKLVQVIKSVHGAGQGRQLGNVQVKSHLQVQKLTYTAFRAACTHLSAEQCQQHGSYIFALYQQMELRDIKTKRKYNVRFRTSDMVERVQLETKDFQVLYVQGDSGRKLLKVLLQIQAIDSFPPSFCL